MATKVESRGGTRPTKVTFNRANNLASAANNGVINESNHEMHVKMSKKIAQLTKVIFSLNTKNDEHEEIVDGLKTAHQEELQNVMIECKEKIGHYKQKMDLVKEQESLINTLQNLLEDERTEKRSVVGEFEDFKQKRNEIETQIGAKHENRLKDFSSKLVRLKDEYESRTQQFESVKRNFETEKEKILSDLSHKHSLEIDMLIKAHRVRYDELANEKQRLQGTLENTHSEKVSHNTQKDSEIKELIKEHNMKCDKLKSFYENELIAAKNKQEAALNEMMEKTKKEEKLSEMTAKRHEQELRNRIRGLTENNEALEAQLVEVMSSLKTNKVELEKSLNNKDHYSDEASRLKQDLGVADVRLNNLQNEMDSLKERCDLQTDELLKKSGKGDL